MARTLPNAARIAGFFLAFGLLASAEDITLKSGEVLKNATVSSVDPASLTVTHDDGLTRIPFQSLPPELQKKYGFTGEGAAKFSQQEAEAKNLAQARAKRDEAYKKLDSIAIQGRAKIIQALSGDALANLNQVTRHWFADKTVREIPNRGNALGPSGLQGTKIVEDKSHWTEELTSLGLCYIASTGTVTDESEWNGQIWRIGLHQYVAAGGFRKTVPKFTANRDDAIVALGLIPDGPPVGRSQLSPEKPLSAAPAKTADAPSPETPAEIKLADGTVFKNATITSKTPSYVMISHEDGTAKVMIENLPTGLKEKYGFDAKEANAFNAVEAKAQSERRALKAKEFAAQKVAENAIVVRGQVVQSVEGGVLIQLEWKNKQWVKHNVMKTEAEMAALWKSLGPNQRPPPGFLDKEVSELEDVWSKLGLCYVASVQNIADGASWSGSVWKTGVYEYNAVGGFKKTVPRFTSKLADAVTALESSGKTP